MVYSFYGGFILIKVRQERNERLLPVGLLFYSSVQEILPFLSFSLQFKFDIFVRRNYEYICISGMSVSPLRFIRRPILMRHFLLVLIQ